MYLLGAPLQGDGVAAVDEADVAGLPAALLGHDVGLDGVVGPVGGAEEGAVAVDAFGRWALLEHFALRRLGDLEADGAGEEVRGPLTGRDGLEGLAIGRRRDDADAGGGGELAGLGDDLAELRAPRRVGAESAGVDRSREPLQ